MKIYDYWSKAGKRAVDDVGSHYWLVGWAGSNSSVQDAKEAAQKRVAGLKEKLESEGWLRDFYEYESDHPIKEMVIERFGSIDNPHAAITRNRYGALVLNAANLFIADVDLPDPEQLERQKSRKKLQDYKDLALSRFADFSRQHPALCFRVYETAAGYRVIVTNKYMEPDSVESAEWMESLDSDKLYRKLCKRQQCYRARLTPKPWRLPGCKSSVFFPNGQYADKYNLKDWLQKYNEESKSFAVCTLIKTYGDGAIAEGIDEVLDIHDKYVLSELITELA
jgi:hypothetical protein